MPMKFIISFLFSSLILLTPLHVEASTLAVIKKQYKCSYDPDSGLRPCQEGIVFYNSEDHALYVSDGTHWRSVTSKCVANTPCSAILNCGTDDCGVSCGTCSANNACSSTTPGTPGSCS